jgi:hypothetical protein
MGSMKAQELRALVGLAIKLRALANMSDDLADTELFLAAALALEGRANLLAFGPVPETPPLPKVDLVC